jgi:hypothetical protein
MSFSQVCHSSSGKRKLQARVVDSHERTLSAIRKRWSCALPLPQFIGRR